MCDHQDQVSLLNCSRTNQKTLDHEIETMHVDVSYGPGTAARTNQKTLDYEIETSRM